MSNNFCNLRKNLVSLELHKWPIFDWAHSLPRNKMARRKANTWTATSSLGCDKWRITYINRKWNYRHITTTTISCEFISTKVFCIGSTSASYSLSNVFGSYYQLISNSLLNKLIRIFRLFPWIQFVNVAMYHSWEDLQTLE